MFLKNKPPVSRNECEQALWGTCAGAKDIDEIIDSINSTRGRLERKDSLENTKDIHEIIKNHITSFGERVEIIHKCGINFYRAKRP